MAGLYDNSTYNDIQTILGSQFDENTATPEELDARIQALRRAGQVDAPQELDQNAIYQTLIHNGISDQEASSIAALPMSELVAMVQQSDQPSGFRTSQTDAAKVLRNGILTGGFFKDNSAQKAQYGADLARLQALQIAQNKKNEGDTALKGLVDSLPGQLKANEDQFIGGLQEQGRQTLEQNLIPETLAGLNLRGVLRSGDLESELANAQAGVQQNIQEQQLALQSQDDQFFQNIAYNTTLRQSLEAGGDVNAQIQQTQNTALQNQKNAFTASQNTLNQNLQQKLYQKQQDRLILQQQNELKRQQDQRDAAQTNALVGGIGSSVGSVVGSKLAVTPGIGT